MWLASSTAAIPILLFALKDLSCELHNLACFFGSYVGLDHLGNVAGIRGCRLSFPKPLHLLNRVQCMELMWSFHGSTSFPIGLTAT